MRTATMRPAVLVLGLAACARGAAVTPGPSNPVAPSAATEDDRAHERTLALRRQILDRASWSDFDDEACNTGALRIFADDTSAKTFEDVTRAVEALERIIIGRGIDNSLDTPAGHALLRSVIGWEAAVQRPRWDVKAGETPRPTIATGLSGRFRNPETGKCEAYVVHDTLTVVVPEGVPGFSAPQLDGSIVTTHAGESGLNRARDAFYVKTANDPNSIFSYVRIRAAVIWRDFAVIAVNRPVEARATVQLPASGGGAAYIFHRVGDEWRLLVISRTWS